MSTRKNTISSVLASDFGIEDFEAGVVATRGNEDNLATFDLSNKLGLLSPLADRHDTEVVTFGSEAYNLLGEAKQLEQYATQQINAANQRFAIAAEIKKGYGVEGFDAFTFGCEGFGEAMKNAFTAIVAGIKKLIQSITNWIRQVMNWVGSQFAKGQAKLIEKYKAAGSPTKSNAQIKAIIPTVQGISSGAQFIKEVNADTTEVAKSIVAINNTASKFFEGTDRSATASFVASAAAKDALDALNKTYVTLHGKKVPVAKLGSATAAANEKVFGAAKLKKITISATKYLTIVKPEILTKDDLNACNGLVKDGKALIKVLNESLKKCNSLVGAMKVAVPSKKKDEAGNKDAKEANAAVKATRAAIKALSNANRIGTMQAGILYGVFANYLKLRSYAAAAIRAILADTKTGKKAPKEGSGKDRLNKARAAING